MKILSLFDGMSCGQQAINNLGIKDYTYFSSEIDKFAIQVTQENYPNTIQIGDVTKIKGEDYKDITLLAGGSPCQGFSFAGKQLNFEDPRSALFFEYVRILKEVKPKYFLLENVRMKKEYQDVISEHLFGIQPVKINSSLVVAQNRVRLYWVGELQNDGTYQKVEISQPKDRGIYLKDILKNEVDEKYNLSEKAISSIYKYRQNYKVTGKTPTLTCELAHGWGKNITPGICREIQSVEKGRREENIRINKFSKFNQDNVSCGKDYKDPKVVAMQVGQPKIITHNIIEKVKVRKYNVDIEGLKKCLKEYKNQTIKEIAEKLNQPKTLVEHWFRNDNSFAIPGEDIWLNLKELLGIKTDEFDKSIMKFEIRDGTFDSSNRAYDIEGKCATLTSSLEPKIIIPEATKKGYIEVNPGECFDFTQPNSKTRRGRSMKDKSNCMTAGNFEFMNYDGYRIRKLTPIECERLQGVKDGYTSSVSNSQRYKMLGNGWTIPVIEHILKTILTNNN